MTREIAARQRVEHGTGASIMSRTPRVTRPPDSAGITPLVLRPRVRPATVASVLAAIIMIPMSLSAAVLIDANVAGVFTDLSFTTPTSAVLTGGDSFGGLNVGDGELIHVDVSNPDAHDVQALFVTLNVDTSRLNIIGGTLEPRILADPGPFGTVFLNALHPTVVGIGNDSTGSKLTGLSHAEPLGSEGLGPDTPAVEFMFQVLDNSTSIEVGLEIGAGNGLLIDGHAIDDANLGSHSSRVQLGSATLYLPEPSSGPLLIAGILGLGGLAVSRRRHDADARGRAHEAANG